MDSMELDSKCSLTVESVEKSLGMAMPYPGPEPHTKVGLIG